MKTKLYLLLMILFVYSSYTSAQTFQLAINADKLGNNHVYGFYPELIRLDIFDGDVKYKLVRGSISIIKSGKTIETVSFSDSQIDGKLLDHDLLPSAKLQVNIEEISEFNSAQVHKINKSISINFARDLEVKPNPNFSILLNNSANHTKFGIDPATIKSVEIRGVDPLKDKPVIVYHIAGTRTTRQAKYANLAEAEKALAGFMKENSVMNGHRIMVEVQAGARKPKIDINIKK